MAQVNIDQSELWKLKAACVGIDIEMFFSEGPGTHGEIDFVRRMCNECPVKQECLEYALDNFMHEGIWGGTTPNERRSIKRGRRSNASKAN